MMMYNGPVNRILSPHVKILILNQSGKSGLLQGDREHNRKTNSAEGKRSQPKMFYKAFLYKLRDTYQGVYSYQL